jgi:hypothetical protein
LPLISATTTNVVCLEHTLLFILRRSRLQRRSSASPTAARTSAMLPETSALFVPYRIAA